MAKATQGELPKDVTGLEALAPFEPAVKFGDETVTAKKFRLKHFTRVFAHVAHLRGSIRDGQFDVEAALATGEEHVYALVELSTGKDRAWFESMDDKMPEGCAAEFTDLVTKVAEVNWDSIGKKILAAAQRFAEKVEEATPQTATGLM